MHKKDKQQKMFLILLVLLLYKYKNKWRKKEKELEDILNGISNKILVIMGPCSVDNEEAILEYAKQILKLQKEVEDNILIVIRTYTSKPRTYLGDYKGIVHKPDLLKEDDIILGIEKMRRIHMRIINETNMLIADELLYLDLYPYIEDTVSYITIGARSVENQQHKLIASAIDKIVGLKNSLNGNIDNALNNIISTRMSNHCIFNGFEIKTEGNRLSHLILRGYQNENGEHFQNIDYNNLMNIVKKINTKNIDNMPIIVDCNHSNSKKDFKKQRKIVEQVIKYRNENKDLKKYLKGVMIESYLKEGNQNISNNMNYGQSITDACIGIEETKEIIYYINQNCN